MIINRCCDDESCTHYTLTVSPRELYRLHNVVYDGLTSDLEQIEADLWRAVQQADERGLVVRDGTCAMPVGETDLPCVRDADHWGDCNWKYPDGSPYSDAT